MEQKTDNNEIWGVYRDTSYHPNGHLWEASTNGNVKIDGEIQTPIMFNGYLVVRSNFVHRIVAITHIPNPENKPCVDHINGDRSDNRVENLRWVTQKENCNNPITYEKLVNGEKTSDLYKSTRSNWGKYDKHGENNPRYGKRYVWIHLDGKEKQIEEEYLYYWLDDGWIYGRTKGIHPAWNKGMSKEEQEYYKSLSLEDKKIYRLNRCKNNI